MFNLAVMKYKRRTRDIAKKIKSFNFRNCRQNEEISFLSSYRVGCCHDVVERKREEQFRFFLVPSSSALDDALCAKSSNKKHGVKRKESTPSEIDKQGA